MLYIQEKHMEIGGMAIPGQVKSVEVSGDAEIDEIQDDKNKKLGYQATGYQPHKISVEVILEETPLMTFDDMVKLLHTLFKPEGQTEAKPLAVINSQTAAHNITQVFFKKIYTKQDISKSYGTASLEFWEYIPTQVTTVASTQGASAATGSTSKGASGGGTKTESPPPVTTEPVTVSAEYQEYLNTKRGSAPKISDKTSKSPAVDR